MWVRRSAIRPVPSYARVPASTLESVRRALAQDDEETRAELDHAFERFERAQPELASHVAKVLSSPLDETALALGYFLVLVVWLSFEKVYGRHLDVVTEQALRATQELLELDEQLRRNDPAEPLDSDDVVAMEQPDLIAFVHEHVGAALEARGDRVDLEDVHVVYRLVLVQVLALSYAVQRPAGYPVVKTELLA